MTGRRPRRRLRLRRKRKGESFGSSAVDVAPDAGQIVVDVVDAATAPEVVGHMGCCVVEAVGSVAVLAALLTAPAYLLMR